MNFIIRNLETKNDILKSHHLVMQQYKNLDYPSFETAIDEMINRHNYKILAGFVDEKMVAIAGYWLARMLYCGRYLQISNFIVDENFRSLGLGKKLLKELEKIAINECCNKIVLDSYTENKQSHSLYYGENYYIRGLHFMKDLPNNTKLT
jgi:ribosomal protein S18 acetylase RimI-like enzyme